MGGYDPCTITDFEIPKKYGLRQTIGDTHSIGGMFRALRTIPVMLDFAKDMEKVCPDALFINYTNPMSMLCLAMFRASSVNTVGLCHSHQACVPELLAELGMPWDGVSYKISGINHMAWLLDATARISIPSSASVPRRDQFTPPRLHCVSYILSMRTEFRQWPSSLLLIIIMIWFASKS